MPLEFNKWGIRFSYPDNWTLDEDGTSAECRTVTVASPGGGFWTLSVLPRGSNPSELVETTIAAMREEYKDLEVEAISEEMAGQDLIGYDLNFYYLDLTNTTQVRAVRGDRATYAVLIQAEDREYAQMADVFRAITTSFLQNMDRVDWRA
ncbi:MAG: hypothetical protein JW818_23440 [Pirellulales bacterium]|nr:hypothetical protein [Pirellulales bacterium]